MTNESGTHETRISRMEGILESVATKDFVREVCAEMLKDINSKFDEQNALLREQNALLRSQMNERNAPLRSEISGQNAPRRSEMNEQKALLRNEIREIHKELKRLEEKHRRIASLGFPFRLR